MMIIHSPREMSPSTLCIVHLIGGDALGIRMRKPTEAGIAMLTRLLCDRGFVTPFSSIRISKSVKVL